MSIQIIPKPEERKPILPEVLFYLSLAVLIAAVASYFVLSSLLQKTEKNIQTIDQEMAALDSSPDRHLETKLFDYQKKINDFSRLLNGYKYSSQIFPLIESLAHPKVSFSNFSAEIQKGTVHVSGSADSFQTVQQQLIIFRNSQFIKDVTLSGVSLGEKGKIPFVFDLGIDPGVFTKK